MAAIIATLVKHIRAEFWRLLTFGVIGASSLASVVGLYALLSRVLWTNGPRTIEYTFANVFVSWLNYEANRHFTFQKQQRSVGSLSRFITVAVIATGLNSILFWFGHEILHILDFVVIILDACIVATFTFTSHRLFTFHERPWRFLNKNFNFHL